MAETTGIEWTDATWSPIRARVKDDAGVIAAAKGYTSLVVIGKKMAGHVGPHCERVSHGCDNCYSESNNSRCLPANGTGLPFDRRSRDLVDSFLDEKTLTQPLRWKTPKRIFVENQSDLFGEWVDYRLVGRAFGVIVAAHWHTFQVLTKHPDRLLEFSKAVMHYPRGDQSRRPVVGWPSNCWLGVSVEDQKTADQRIPLLLKAQAPIRFISYEPALKGIDIYQYLGGDRNPIGTAYGSRGLDWVIAGYESGRGARAADEEWIRRVKNQCLAAGVAFFYKQKAITGHAIPLPELDGQIWKQFPKAA